MALMHQTRTREAAAFTTWFRSPFFCIRRARSATGVARNGAHRLLARKPMKGTTHLRAAGAPQRRFLARTDAAKMPHVQGDVPLHLVDVTMFANPRGDGGVVRYLRSKREWLERHTAWHHSIVVPGPSRAGMLGVPAPPLPFSGGYRFPLRRRQAAHMIASLEPDLIEAGDPYRLAWAALDAGALCGVPVVAFAHSNVVALAGRTLGEAAARVVRRYLHRLYGQLDCVFAASRWVADELAALGLANVRLQPLGVDCERFSPAHRDPTWKTTLGLPADARVLLFVGRWAPEKNLHVLAQAVATLGAPYWLVCIGAGPTPPAGERVIRVPYERSVAALAAAYAGADVFVHAGDQETFGLAPLEALACGTPVVVRGCAGLADLVDGDACVAADLGTPAAFADAIDAICTRGVDALDRLRAAARRRALAYDHQRVFRALLGHYRAVHRAHGATVSQREAVPGSADCAAPPRALRTALSPAPADPHA